MTTTTQPKIRLQPDIIPGRIVDLTGQDEGESLSTEVHYYQLGHTPHWVRDLMENEDFCHHLEVGISHYPGYDLIGVGNDRTFPRDYLHMWMDLLTHIMERGEYRHTELVPQPAADEDDDILDGYEADWLLAA